MALTSRVWRRAYISVAIILGAAGLAHAMTVVMPSDDQMIIESRAIVRAKVLSVSAGYDEQSGHVFTYVKLRVLEVFKGDIRDSEIVIKQLGGATADHLTRIFGARPISSAARRQFCSSTLLATEPFACITSPWENTTSPGMEPDS